MMTSIRRLRAASGAAVLMGALTLNVVPAAAQEPDRFAGRSLVDALRTLQERGLRIVFTSAVVTPDLRVRIEPRAPTPRQQLDELLAPHGLKARDGPGGTIQIVQERAMESAPRPAARGTIEGRVVDAVTSSPLEGAAVEVEGQTGGGRTDGAGRFLLRNVRAGSQTIRASAARHVRATRGVVVPPGGTTTITVRLSPATATHVEHVTVRRPRPYRKDRGLASEASLDGTEVERLYGSLADDPMRAVQTFPRVSAIDDFRSEFAVRGSPFRHVNLVVDGASTQWLQHTAHGRGATGSLAMFGSPVLETVTLQTGAYPRRFGDRLGPQLELTVREGSREQFRLRGALGGSNLMLLAEGPLGSSTRGSWLVAARQSLLEWPTRGTESTRTAFGFSDGLAKIVYDLRPTQQISLSVLSGMSNVDGEDNLSSNELGDGTNRASMVNLSWRSTFGSGVALTQRAYVVTQRFLNKYQTGRDSDRGARKEVVYRADVARAIGPGLLEAGAQVGRSAMRDAPRSEAATEFVGSSWTRSGDAHFAWAATPTVTVSPGLRVTDAGLLRRRTLTRWILGEWAFRAGWTLNASAGVSHQFPDLYQVLGAAGSTELIPERAVHLDVGIERRLPGSMRWQATLFSRREQGILREPDAYPRLVGGVITPQAHGRYTNALQGFSRGLELVIGRQSASGLSGWASYSYGKNRYTDTDLHEAFWGDFDQRHAFNLFGVYRFSERASVGATYRAGSNFPIPGYFASRDGRVFVGAQRNRVRLPHYSRLDVRANRGFDYLGRHVTLFVEVRNVLNRANAGRADGSVNPATGEATGFTDTLLRRRASAGILIEF